MRVAYSTALHVVTSVAPLLSALLLIWFYYYHPQPLAKIVWVETAVCALCFVASFYYEDMRNWVNCVRVALVLVVSTCLILTITAYRVLQDTFSFATYHGLVGVLMLALFALIGLLTALSIHEHGEIVYEDETFVVD